MNTVRYHHGEEFYPQGNDIHSLMNRDTDWGQRLLLVDVLPLGGPDMLENGPTQISQSSAKLGWFCPKTANSGRPYPCAQTQMVEPNSSQLCTVNGPETTGTNQTTEILPSYQKHKAASSLSPFHTLWNLPGSSGGWCSTQVYSFIPGLQTTAHVHTKKEKSFSKYVKNNENKQSYYPNKSKCIST